MPRPSAVASQFAAYWVADALAGDEVLDFSVTKALVARSPDSLTGAPVAVREHVALRCLQEVVSIASEGEIEGEAAAAPEEAAGILGVDTSRSCEDVLLLLIGEVGSSGSLEKGILPHFNQDIQKFICVKGPTLPETSFELLREALPKITPMGPPSPMEQNGNNTHDNFESFCNTSHDLVNKEKTGFATDGAQLRQDGLANSVNDDKTGNLQKDAMASTPGFHQPENSCCDQPQGDDAIDAVGVNIRSPKDSATNVDKHMSVSAEPSLASCTDMLGSNTGSTPEQDTIIHNTMVQPPSCGVKNPNILHNNDGNGHVNNIRPSKVSIHEGPTMQPIVSPSFDRSNDALPPNISETIHLPKSVTVEHTVLTSDICIAITHPNSPQHDKVNQELDYGRAGIPSVGRNSGHDQRTLQTATALPSEGCNGAIQSQSCGVENPNTLHNNDGNGPPVNLTSIQTSKVSIHEGALMQITVSPAFDRSNDALLASTSETSHLPEFITVKDTVMTSEPHISRTHPNSPKHDKANQDVDYDSAGMPSVINDSGHDERTLQTAAALPSEGCNGGIQGDKSGIKDPPENATVHTKMFEQQSSDNVHLEVDCSDKANQALYDDDNVMKKNTIFGELNVQTALESFSLSMALPNKISEPHLSEQNIEKNTTGVQKYRCNIPNSPWDANDIRDKKASHQKTMGDNVAETSPLHSSDNCLSGLAAAGLLSMTGKILSCTQDNDANGPLEGSSQQDLCIKCGKDGQLLKCSSCLLAAHDRCFGSSVTFDDSGQFYCPVCLYTKATQAYQKAKRTYSEARKNLSIFLGRRQLVEQREQPAVVGQKATNSKANLDGCNASRRQDNRQYLADESQAVRQRKRQKKDATGNSCPQEVAIEKVPVVQNRDFAPMNKCSVLQNNRNRAPVAEHEQPEENVEAHGESGNDDPSYKPRHSYHPAGNQNVDADKEDGLTGSHQSEDSDEIEATSSNHSSKQPSPPWRNMRNSKARCHDKDTALPSNSKRPLGSPDQHMASPSRKGNYAYSPKRYCNPVAPNGRRTKLCWTEQEEAALREAMSKFTPKGDGSIPWVQILEYGRDAFHKSRLASDLRVKWRNMKKKSGS